MVDRIKRKGKGGHSKTMNEDLMENDKLYWKEENRWRRKSEAILVRTSTESTSN